MKREYILGILLSLSVIYGFFVTVMKSKVMKESQVQYVIMRSQKDSLQADRDSTLFQLKKAEERIDNLSLINSDAGKELFKFKKEIRDLLYKNKITSKELSRAKTLIVQLNTRISDIIKENDELKVVNNKLADDKNQLTIERNQLTKVLDSTIDEKKKSDDLVELGSTLSVSNVIVSGINKKGKVTDVAEKVTVLRLKFTINENLISKSEKKTVHFVLIDPLGNTIGNHGVVSTKEGEVVCTAETTVDYSTGLVKDVVFDIPMEKLKTDGIYKAHIYEKGIKIGEKSVGLKKKKILGLL